MPDILLQHADILTLDTEGRVLRDAAVAISAGMITAVGEIPADFQADEVVDATGHIIMPGFFNAHAHSAMTLFAVTLRIYRSTAGLTSGFSRSSRP